MNFYSGPDRGNEKLTDGINLKLPSGSLLDWGNVDFDVNLIIHDYATAADGQCFFDIFTTEGFIGDLLCVNMVAGYHWGLPNVGTLAKDGKGYAFSPAA